MLLIQQHPLQKVSAFSHNLNQQNQSPIAITEFQTQKKPLLAAFSTRYYHT